MVPVQESQLLREAMAEVEQDRNKLSGVIVSRFVLAFLRFLLLIEQLSGAHSRVVRA